MENKRVRSWCYTLNNYSAGEEEHISKVESKYHVYGHEVSTDGTPHLQGFIVFEKAKTMSAVKKIMSNRMHLEIMRGTHKQASDYCKKDGDYVESGVHPKTAEDGGQMEKDRWALALEQARTTGEVEDPHIAFVHARVVEYIHLKEEMKKPRLDTEEKMLWYWGESGTGKSRKAREDHPDAYLKMCNKWWDGYANEEVVLLEDLDRAHGVLCHHLKIWADRYPFLAEVKGAGRKIRPRLIVVTSNWHPNQIWNAPEDLEPILRRFECVEFKKLKDHDTQEEDI